MSTEAKITTDSSETTNIIDASHALLEAASEFTAADSLHQSTMLAFRKHIHRLLQRADLPLKELSHLAGIYAKLLRAEMAFRKASTPRPGETKPASQTAPQNNTQNPSRNGSIPPPFLPSIKLPKTASLEPEGTASASPAAGQGQPGSPAVHGQ